MKVFLIGDLHLNHRNIIRYCNRPFNSVEEMNKTLIKRWNNAVTDNDLVIFLGDLAMGTNRRKWLKKLNGKIIFIKGNHDNWGCDYCLINNNILLIHNPHKVLYFNGWIIHGHHHNNTKLIDKNKKRINVSCENTNYKPIELKDIMKV